MSRQWSEVVIGKFRVTAISEDCKWATLASDTEMYKLPLRQVREFAVGGQPAFLRIRKSTKSGRWHVWPDLIIPYKKGGVKIPRRYVEGKFVVKDIINVKSGSTHTRMTLMDGAGNTYSTFLRSVDDLRAALSGCILKEGHLGWEVVHNVNLG